MAFIDLRNRKKLLKNKFMQQLIFRFMYITMIIFDHSFLAVRYRPWTVKNGQVTDLQRSR